MKLIKLQNSRWITIIFLIIVLFAIGCREEPPVLFDGQGTLEMLALADTTYIDTIPGFAPMKNAKVIIVSEYGIIMHTTDEYGYVRISNLPSASYQISVRQPHPDVPSIMLVGSIKDIIIGADGRVAKDTIFAEQVPASGIVINEIYAGGPLNNIFFFYDQFVELYNYSDSVKFLDGIQIMRVSGNTEGKGPGADEDDDGDIDGVTYIFKFPGNPGEQNYPIFPQQFVVCASTAINHKNTVSTSVDLSKADWEFYNQFSPTDFDNPNVPNLINIRSDRTVDFLINLVSDVIVVADGRDTVWQDGIDISTILDGIQYKSSHTTKKTLDYRVDKSYMLSPPRYSGQSMRRREPGVDTNNGLLDWEIIPVSTPGFH